MNARSALRFLGALAAVPRRFPFALAAAAVASFAAMVMVGRGSSGTTWEERIVFCAVLAFPLCVGAALWTEGRRGLVPHLAAIGAALGAWFAFPGVPLRDSETTSLLLLILAATALASAVPGLRGGADLWWRMNLGTLNATILAVIFALAVLLGLQLALFSLRELFGWRNPDAAPRVFAFCVFFVGPAALLAALPRLDAAEGTFDPWRLLSKFALVPLGLLYTGILAAYAVKILWERRLPDGMVAWPVLALGAYGTAAMLLSWPWTRTESWGRWFARLYPTAFLAGSVLLFIALATRITAEGVTAERFLGLAAGAWFVLAALLFLLAPARAPVAVTISFVLIALISAIGPFSASAVSLVSQSDRLTRALAADWKNNEPLEREIESRVRYLARQYGIRGVEPFAGPLTVESDRGWNIGLAALERLGHPAGRENRPFRSWRTELPADTEGMTKLFPALDLSDNVTLGKAASGEMLSIGRRGRTLGAFVADRQIHTFALPAEIPAPDAPPVAFDWTFENRTFRLVVFSFSLRGDEVSDVRFVVLEK